MSPSYHHAGTAGDEAGAHTGREEEGGSVKGMEGVCEVRVSMIPKQKV